MFKTIDVLIKYGCMEKGPYYDSAMYKDDFLQINACSGLNLKLGSPYSGEDCVTINGFYKTKRELTYIEFDMPSEFEAERNGLVWFLMTLERQLGKHDWENYCKYKVPPIKITKTDHFIFPWVINRKNERKENILELKKIVDALHFYISREELGRLRKLIRKSSTDSVDIVEAKVYFDGEIVTWKTNGFKYAGIATGVEWENPVTVLYSKNWGLPPKFWGDNHFLSFSAEGLFVDYNLNNEVKIIGNTVGQVDIFEAEMMSWLLKFAYFYPKYDGDVDRSFDEKDFREWVLKELGTGFEPYLNCLAAMVRVSPFYKDDVNVDIVKLVIDFFKEFSNDIDSRTIYTALEKKFNTVDKTMFNRVLAGWKCWCKKSTTTPTLTSRLISSLRNSPILSMSEDSTPETLKVIRENLAEYRKKQPEEFEQKNIKINSTEEKQKTTSCSIMTSPWTRLWRKEYDSPANYHDLNPTDDTTPTTERMAEDLEVEIQAERVAKCNQEKSDATTMSNLVDLYINASRNESPLPLNEDSSDASLDLLISRIREDKKEHPEKNVRLEDEKSD